MYDDMNNDDEELTPVVVLGDTQTIERLNDLNDIAHRHGCHVAATYAFAVGEAVAADDLEDVEAVVAAVADAIASRRQMWAPWPAEDLGREQHLRRLTLVLQRHGSNLRIGPHLVLAPLDGGLNAVDYALRVEVRSVDALDAAALARAGAETLHAEVRRACQAPATGDDSLFDATEVAGEDTMHVLTMLQLSLLTELERRHGPAPQLPPTDASWDVKRPLLKAYARWLIGVCGQTQQFTADALTALGHHTRYGRPWQQGTISALVNGKYDRGLAA